MNSPEIIGLMVLGLVVLSTLVVNLVQLSRFGRIQKNQISFDPSYVPTPVCKTAHLEIERRFAQVEKDLALGRLESKQDREHYSELMLDELGKVHNRVNQVLEAVSELRGEMRATPHKPQ